MKIEFLVAHFSVIYGDIRRIEHNQWFGVRIPVLLYICILQIFKLKNQSHRKKNSLCTLIAPNAKCSIWRRKNCHWLGYPFCLLDSTRLLDPLCFLHALDSARPSSRSTSGSLWWLSPVYPHHPYCYHLAFMNILLRLDRNKFTKLQSKNLHSSCFFIWWTFHFG